MIGYVYKIEYVLNPEIFYIGSTKSKLSQRMGEHRSNYKRWLNNEGRKCIVFDYFKEYGNENFRIVEIERVEVEDRQELLKYEDRWICELDCINKRRAYTTIEEKKEYNKKFKKLYRETNREKVLEQERKSREKNKEKKREYKKEWSSQRVKCPDCNKEMNKSSLNKHIKSKH